MQFAATAVCAFESIIWQMLYGKQTGYGCIAGKAKYNRKHQVPVTGVLQERQNIAVSIKCSLRMYCRKGEI